MNNEVMFSSKSDQWATPQDFFDRLNEEFCFTLDPCATDENHKVENYFTADDNGLLQNWGGSVYFVTHLIAKLGNGLKSVTKKQSSLKRLLLC